MSTKKERSEIAKKRAAKMPKGYFSRIATEMQASRTPRQRRKAALRLVEQRRAKQKV